MARWRSRTGRKASPSAPSRCVEPSMSVKTNVTIRLPGTVPSGTPRAGTGKARSGCEASWRVRLRVRAAGGAALQKLFGASNPARHAEGAELLARDVEELVRPVAIPVQLAADLHPGLVEVDERAQRARALLFEDGAGALEPVACL